MKKFGLLLVAALMICSAPAMSQAFSFGTNTTNASGQTSGILRSTPTHAAVDTVTNATAKHQYATINGYQNLIGIQASYIEISGASAGTIKLYGSINGTNYEQIGTDSLLITDVTTSQGKIFQIAPSKHVYFRLTAQGTGTMSGKLDGKWITRREPPSVVNNP